jgi:hypothetical protein
MARVWLEGFENYLPHGQYLEGGPYSGIYEESPLTRFPENLELSTGRNFFSKYCLQTRSNTVNDAYIEKILTTSLDELYLRAYVKYQATGTGRIITFWVGLTYPILEIGQTTGGGLDVKTGNGSAFTTSKSSFSIQDNTWLKYEVYCKVSTGALTIKINNKIQYTTTGLSLGSNNISKVRIGRYGGFDTNRFQIDDIALNDTTGSKNNSWCGDATIIGLNVKGAGHYSQFNLSQGWTLAEADTNTTTLKITGHGLSNDDVIYNVNRNAYRIVAVSDVNTLTMTAITNQAEGDTIIAFTNQATITAGSGTSTSKAVLVEHTLESYDVIVNTTRSNAIRRIIYIDGNDCYNRYSSNTDYTGETITSQASGDTIKTFKVKQYTISDHYKAVMYNQPNPQYSNVQTTVTNQIDSFDIEELVADKLVVADTEIIAVSHNTYIKEKGAGSKIKPIIRLDSTDHTGTTVSLIGATLVYSNIYENSPFTSDDWTVDEVDNLEIGIKVV